jgi:hypothetical protein
MRPKAAQLQTNKERPAGPRADARQGAATGTAGLNASVRQRPAVEGGAALRRSCAASVPAADLRDSARADRRLLERDVLLPPLRIRNALRWAAYDRAVPRAPLRAAKHDDAASG